MSKNFKLLLLEHFNSSFSIESIDINESERLGLFFATFYFKLMFTY